MSPSFSHGARGQVYRYYVSAPLQQGQRRKSDDSAIRRVPAPALEALLADLLTRRTPSSQADPLELLTRVEEIGRASCRERVCQYVSISEVAVSVKKKYNISEHR